MPGAFVIDATAVDPTVRAQTTGAPAVAGASRGPTQGSGNYKKRVSQTTTPAASAIASVRPKGVENRQ